MTLVSTSKSALRTQFFDRLFAAREGWICIATKDQNTPNRDFTQKFFRWPDDSKRMENYILSVEQKFNVYFCVNLLSKPERKKAYCLPCDFLWADLDEVVPYAIQPPPQIVLQSSPNRFQALWLISVQLDCLQAEQYCKRIAYSTSADKSGWDLTQLLRVPHTFNHKYAPAPEVSVFIAGETRCAPLLFEAMPQVPESEGDEFLRETPFPEAEDLPDIDSVLYKFSNKLAADFHSTYDYEPGEDEDWSRLLWKQIHTCFEAGMTLEETFVVCVNSKVNKYKRDKRPIVHMWRDIIKASKGLGRFNVISANFRPVVMPKIYDHDLPIHEDLFIDRYREWGIEATDAVPQFHDLCSMILLSTIIANSVRLETSYDHAMVPNLWGMILGDSTLSRKTTAMRMVTDLIATIDPELVLATDGTAEGLLTGLETRPNKTSIFYKDELSGFFESVNRREYLAGMPETLTALYDVPPIYTRRLRKETIRIESPIFVFFGGGVRDKVYENLTENYVLSGFLPRFLIVSGNTDMERLRKTGPPTEAGKVRRASLLSELADMYENYASDVKQKIMGQSVVMPPRIMADLTSSAWERYGNIESLMVNTASESAIPNLALPTFERLSRSMLKMALIIGASRQAPKDERIKIEEKDILTAASYIQVWGEHSIDAITNAGKLQSERKLDRIVDSVTRNPGILRSTLMQHFHLTKRDADDVLGTLEDRGLIRREKAGRGYAYFAA